MAWLLNNIDLFTGYNIRAGHIPGGNIALDGCFNLPERTGKTFHEWEDEHGIEAYTDSAYITFAGRDLRFIGTIQGSKAQVYDYLTLLNTAIKAFTSTVNFATPYGTFAVTVSGVKVNHFNGICQLDMTMREPVVTLTGGTLPATGASAFTFDSRPFHSFGLYPSTKKEMTDLPEMKEHYFTKYETEGFQIAYRRAENLNIQGFIIGDNLADFISKVKSLYALFSAAGTRTVLLNKEMTVTCYADQGFKLNDVIINYSTVIGRFNINLRVITITH